MACTGADGIRCNDFGIVLPCGPEPPQNDEILKVVFTGPLVMSDLGITVQWVPEADLETGPTIAQFLITAKVYHGIYAYQEEIEIQAGGSTSAFIPFTVETAVVYKLFARREVEGEVGPWTSQYVFYGGTEYGYLVDAATDYLVQDDDETIYLVVEDVPAPSDWAVNPDGTLMLDPDGNPVAKQ